MFKVTPRVEIIEAFKKSCHFASCPCFASCIMKKHHFYHGGKKRRFFHIFTTKLSSAALSCLNGFSTSNFILL